MPPSNIPGSHLGEMAFVTVTRDDMDVFFPCSSRAIACPFGNVSSKERTRNEGAAFYTVNAARCMPGGRFMFGGRVVEVDFAFSRRGPSLLAFSRSGLASVRAFAFVRSCASLRRHCVIGGRNTMASLLTHGRSALHPR